MINILPYNQKKMIRRTRCVRIVVVAIWSTIILILVAGVLFLPTLLTINTRYAIARGQTDRLQQSGVIITAADIALLEKRTKAVKDKLAVPAPLSPMDYTTHIRAHETSGITLIGYDMGNTDKLNMQVRGIAATRQALQQFVAALQEEATIATVDSPVTNFVKSSESEFTITVTFKPI